VPSQPAECKRFQERGSSPNWSERFASRKIRRPGRRSLSFSLSLSHSLSLSLYIYTSLSLTSSRNQVRCLAACARATKGIDDALRTVRRRCNYFNARPTGACGIRPRKTVLVFRRCFRRNCQRLRGLDLDRAGSWCALRESIRRFKFPHMRAALPSVIYCVRYACSDGVTEIRAFLNLLAALLAARFLTLRLPF